MNIMINFTLSIVPGFADWVTYVDVGQLLDQCICYNIKTTIQVDLFTGELNI